MGSEMCIRDRHRATNEMNALRRIMERLQGLNCNDDEKIDYRDIVSVLNAGETGLALGSHAV